MKYGMAVFVVTAVAVAIPSAFAACPDFAPAQNFLTAGIGSAGAAAADFNGDRKTDLAILNLYSRTVAILPGKGDGTFATPRVAFSTGAYSYSIVAADFDGDGESDLAMSDVETATVSVFIGKGDGTFNAEVTYDTMANPFAIFVADFNADGKPDLAMASDAGFVAVLPGNGDGTFGTVLLSPAGSQQLSLAAADLDGDGNLDLMVVDSDGDKVTTLLGAATEDSHLDRQRRPPGTDRARLRSATLTAMGKPMWW